MKNLTYFIMSVLFVTLALGLGTKTAMAEDLVKVMPKDVKVIVDNDRVRVLDVLHKPGVKRADAFSSGLCLSLPERYQGEGHHA